MSSPVNVTSHYRHDPPSPIYSNIDTNSYLIRKSYQGYRCKSNMNGGLLEISFSAPLTSRIVGRGDEDLKDLRTPPPLEKLYEPYL